MVHRRRADARERETLVRSVLQSGDPWWARELLEEADSGSGELQALRIEVELAMSYGDASGLIPAWLERHRDDGARALAVDWWVRSDRVEEAERLVQGSTGLTLWQARLALWRRQPEVARALLSRVAAGPERSCLEGVAAVLEGSLQQAESLLRPLLHQEGQTEASFWLVTVLRKQRRYAEAVQAAEAANFASTVFNLVPTLERDLAAARDRDAKRSALSALWQFVMLWLRPARRPEHAAALKEYAAALRALGLAPEDSLETLEAGIERLGGNHMPHPTMVEDGGLVSCKLPPDPRHLGASIQLVLWTRGVEAVRALYRDLAPRVDGHPLFRIYQGEFELWMGAYEDAARIFREVLSRDRETRWAWIGLGASCMLQGELREAQTIWKKGLSVTRFAGPTLYAYRGECYRRQGDVTRARRDLDVALQQKPQRISARINRALLDGGNEALESVERDCVAHAPLLMESLSGSSAERLENVLSAMRGNRSSSPWHVSYHLWGRVWRRAA